MMYPFLTLDDGAEIVHSERKQDGQVKVNVEKPDDRDFFHNITPAPGGFARGAGVIVL